MTTYEPFDLTLLSTQRYENTSTTANLSTDMTVSDKNDFNWPVLILSVFAITGVLGNLLVCISISFDKQLQTNTNWFLFSLSIADSLVSLIVLPLAVIKDFYGSWRLPIILCNLYIFFDVLSCTTSIWHLTILSIDRFFHISRPFKSRERSKRNTCITIIFIWTFSIAISCIVLILGFINESNILIRLDEQRHSCGLNNASFIIYGSIICFCIPCTLMLVTYSLTIRRLQVEAAKCYSDPDDNLPIRRQPSERLRRHRLSSKRTTSQCHSHSSSKDMSSSSPTTPCLSTANDIDNMRDQIQTK